MNGALAAARTERYMSARPSGLSRIWPPRRRTLPGSAFWINDLQYPLNFQFLEIPSISSGASPSRLWPRPQQDRAGPEIAKSEKFLQATPAELPDLALAPDRPPIELDDAELEVETVTAEHRPHPHRPTGSSAAQPPRVRRPDRLLTQNSELKRLGIWNWSIPALAARLPDGRTIRICPSAGVCARVCYARAGRYNIPAVRARHLANLAYVLEDPEGWEQAMIAELAAARFDGRWVRIHDAGDFFSTAYLAAWLRIIQARPQVRFYAYTKEIGLFRRLVEPDPPGNFWWVSSYGGTQDRHLDPGADRVADVFPTEEAITDAGWHSQTASDLLAVTGPTPVGIPANNIPRFRHRQGDQTFGEWQRRTDAPEVTGHHRRPARRGARSTGHPQRLSADPATGRCTHRQGPRHDDEPPTGRSRRAAPAGDTAEAGHTGEPEATP